MPLLLLLGISLLLSGAVHCDELEIEDGDTTDVQAQEETDLDRQYEEDIARAMPRSTPKPPEPEEPAAAEAPEPPPAPPAEAKKGPDEDTFKKMRVKELRHFLYDRGVKCEGCAEKSDFIAKAIEARDLPTREDKDKADAEALERAYAARNAGGYGGYGARNAGGYGGYGGNGGYGGYGDYGGGPGDYGGGPGVNLDGMSQPGREKWAKNYAKGYQSGGSASENKATAAKDKPQKAAEPTREAKSKPVLDEATFKKMRVKELRHFLYDRGVKCEGCAEKSDFIAKAVESRNLPTTEQKEKQEADSLRSVYEKLNLGGTNNAFRGNPEAFARAARRDSGNGPMGEL